MLATISDSAQYYLLQYLDHLTPCNIFIFLAGKFASIRN